MWNSLFLQFPFSLAQFLFASLLRSLRFLSTFLSFFQRFFWSRDNVVCISTGLLAGQPGVRTPTGALFVFQNVGTDSDYYQVSQSLGIAVSFLRVSICRGMKLNTSLSSAEVKNVWRYTSSSLYAFTASTKIYLYFFNFFCQWFSTVF